MISLCSFTRRGLRFPEWLPHDKNNNNLFSTHNNICSIHQWLKMMKLLLLFISEMEGPLQQVQLLNLLLERSMIFTPCPFIFHKASYHHAALSLQLWSYKVVLKITLCDIEWRRNMRIWLELSQVDVLSTTEVLMTSFNYMLHLF